jgi:hypothetical protein
VESLTNAEWLAIEKANAEPGAQSTGALVVFVAHEIEQPASIQAQGTWAVTG